MSIWAIADLHLSLGIPNKEMDIFGPKWVNHTKRVEEAWRDLIKEDDLILIPGDISWALHVEQVIPDLQWIHSLPGTKVMIKGNHDYWWNSLSKIKQILPPSIHLIQNDSFIWNEVVIGGSRLWDSSEFDFDTVVEMQENPKAKVLTESDISPDREKIFKREVGRLENSLKSMNAKNSSLKIVMTHYPPIGVEMKDSDVSRLLEKYHVNICVFGHVHNVRSDLPLFGEHHGIHYYLVACDHLDCRPLKIHG